jgi:hypothetical protein
MNTFLRISLILISSFLFTICLLKSSASVYEQIPAKHQEPVHKQELIMTRFQDIQSGKRPPSYDNFGPGEVPSVYLNNFDGQTVTIKIYNVSTGDLITQFKSTYIPAYNAQYWMLDDLPSGSYKASVLVGAEEMDSQLFNVSK